MKASEFLTSTTIFLWKSYGCPALMLVKPPFSYGNPMVVLHLCRLNHHFPMGNPMVFLWFSCHLRSPSRTAFNVGSTAGFRRRRHLLWDGDHRWHRRTIFALTFLFLMSLLTGFTMGLLSGFIIPIIPN